MSAIKPGENKLKQVVEAAQNKNSEQPEQENGAALAQKLAAIAAGTEKSSGGFTRS